MEKIGEAGEVAEQLNDEDVVERTERYNIVRKHAGQPQRLAEATDPRI